MNINDFKNQIKSRVNVGKNETRDELARCCIDLACVGKSKEAMRSDKIKVELIGGQLFRFCKNKPNVLKELQETLASELQFLKDNGHIKHVDDYITLNDSYFDEK